MDLLNLTFREWFLVTTFSLGLCTYPIILSWFFIWLKNEIRWRQKQARKKRAKKENSTCNGN